MHRNERQRDETHATETTVPSFSVCSCSSIDQTSRFRGITVAALDASDVDVDIDAEEAVDAALVVLVG